MDELASVTYRMIAPNIPQTAKVARDMVAGLMRASGRAALADPARPLVSELVSNVHLHTDVPQLQLSASVNGSMVLVSVEDRDKGSLPLARALDVGADDDECGRGLLLVQECAKAWGVTRRPDSKRVWFELHDGCRGT